MEPKDKENFHNMVDEWLDLLRDYSQRTKKIKDFISAIGDDENDLIHDFLMVAYKKPKLQKPKSKGYFFKSFEYFLIDRLKKRRDCVSLKVMSGLILQRGDLRMNLLGTLWIAPRFVGKI